MTTVKWTFTDDEEHWNNAEFFTEQEAIEAGKDYYYDTNEETTFYVGWIKEPDVIVEGEKVAYDVSEGFRGQCGSYADHWFSNIKVNDLDSLSRRLEETVKIWLKETGNVPTFHTIGGWSEYTV